MANGSEYLRYPGFAVKRLPALLSLACILTGCTSRSQDGSSEQIPAPAATRQAQSVSSPDTESLKAPALIATDITTGALVYWPTRRGSRKSRREPITFTQSLGAYWGYAMAANGDTLVIANANPREIMTYNIKNKRMTTFKDKYGMPYDVAVDKKGNIYAMNTNSIIAYPVDSNSEKKLTCNQMTENETIGADNEGDVFVNGYDGNDFGVVEYPVRGGKCKALNLQPELGYPGGVGVDPKTDDLIVIDNPGVCAGGPLTARMTIYPRPYHSTNFTQANLHATYCDGIFRLDKDSMHIYLADQTYDINGEVIDVRTFPAGTGHGYYSRKIYGSYDQIGGFTAVPNALPN
jgi:PBP1b-binding outer membrane lipoprotein LpoB